MNAKQFCAALDRAGLSRNQAARDLGLDPRTVRRYVAGDLPVPRVVELALLGLATLREAPAKRRAS